MLVRFLIYIKHHFSFIWQIIEWLNAILFSLLHDSKFIKVVPSVIKRCNTGRYYYRPLKQADLSALQALINSQSSGRIDYFKPHGFDEKSLLKTFKNPSFIMMGTFAADEIVGYFFLRCFWNKKCFVGRLIDEPYEGKGIGRVMNEIMYNIAWEAGFRCLSTISKSNQWVMRAHAKNPYMKVLKNLDNDCLLVEFLEPSR
jgi:hypothetical protein